MFAAFALSKKESQCFSWLIKQNADMCFPQETYGTEEIENQ